MSIKVMATINGEATKLVLTKEGANDLIQALHFALVDEDKPWIDKQIHDEYVKETHAESCLAENQEGPF